MTGINAPGCYGSVLSFSSEDVTCVACSHHSQCGEKAYESLLELRKVMDVSEFEKRFNIERVKRGQEIVNARLQSSTKPKRRDPLTPEQRALVNDETLPVKPRKLIGSIFRKGFDGEYLLKAICKGINPFAGEKPEILDKAFQLFLIHEGQYTKKTLHQTFMEMGMKQRTAHSQVSIVVAALEILGVTEFKPRSGLIKLKERQ